MSPGNHKSDHETDDESPLIEAQNTGDDEDVLNDPLGHDLGLEGSAVESKSVWYLILLTLSIGGLQIVWSVELSNGSPYLLSLGMSKALVAVVWLAGPLTGVLVQPYVGMVSDRCQVSWGRRKPFMIAGTVGTVLSSLLLAYAKDICWILGPWTSDKYEGGWRGTTIAFATIMMWCLDFSINTVQAAIRAFIVDGAPAHQQESANAWASRLTGVGNVFGYIFGYLDLPNYLPFLGNTEFKILCTLASVALSSSILISILTVKERNPQEDELASGDDKSTGLITFFKQTFHAIRRLSPIARSVCIVQFFHWMGWFPFLFYVTTYIGQLYVDPLLRPGMSEDEIHAVWAKATRIGTLALLVEAIVTLAANIILPFLVVPSFGQKIQVEDTTAAQSASARHGRTSQDSGMHDRPFLSSSTILTPRVPANYQSQPRTFVTPPTLLNKCLLKLQIPGLTLRRAWLFSQFLHVACMLSTFLISTPVGATVMTAFMGITWSLSLWAPFALISGDIAQREQARRQKNRQKLLNGSVANDDGADEHDAELGKSSGEEEEEDRAGIVLGLHNVAVSFPQIIATLISSLIFKFLQKDRGEPGDVSVAWTLRVSIVAVLVASFFTWRMKNTGIL